MRTSQVNDVHTDILITPLEKFSQGLMVIAQKGKVKLSVISLVDKRFECNHVHYT